MKKSVRFNDSEIDSQKNCVPGPNVVFPRFSLPMEKYIKNMKNKGSLGCGPEQYPKYDKGKYCCVDTMSSKQEKFDYINNLLENAVNNLGPEHFKRSTQAIFYLMRERKLLYFSDNSLIDNLDIPTEYEDLDDWVDDMLDKYQTNKLNKTVDDVVNIPTFMYNMKKEIPSENISSMKKDASQANSDWANEYNLDKSGGRKKKRTIKRKKTKRIIKKRKTKRIIKRKKTKKNHP